MSRRWQSYPRLLQLMNLPLARQELPQLSPQRMPRRLPRPRKLRRRNHRPERIQREILRAGSAEGSEADLEDQAADMLGRTAAVRVVGADFSKWG
jgi:hypothetical protein